MKIVCAPDSFKECLSSTQVALAMAEGVRRADRTIECDVCPIGDGGEGTMEALINAVGGEYRSCTVADPFGRPMQARLGLIDGGRRAIVELAEASGLSLVPPNERDPARTTTFGTGQLIDHAVRAKCEEIIVCIGGSATIDGGTGLAQALGWRFFDEHGHEIVEPLMCGGLLGRIAKVIKPERRFSRIRVACDVTNPLCGPNGAAAVYGPQKGATAEQVRMLDEGLANLARIVGGDPNEPGAGAAGGAGLGIVVFCGATLEPGIDLVLDAVRFDERVRGANLVLTGEGRLDAQSIQGKACIGVANRAARFGVPTIAIVGSTEPDLEQLTEKLHARSLSQSISLADRFGRPRALAEATELIAQVASEIVTGWPR